MKLEEIPEGSKDEEIKTCDVCGIYQKILTQYDDCPYFHKKIYLMCTCGNYIEFNIAIN